MSLDQFTRRSLLSSAVCAVAASSVGAIPAASGAPTTSTQPAGKPIRYEELLPVEFDEAFRRFPVCYVPIGSIEWHGEHLPLGVDAMRATMICQAASARFGGIVYPPIYSGIPPETGWDPKYGYNANVMIDEPAFRALITGVVVRLKKTGFRGIILLTGHHPNTQPLVLREIAKTQSDANCSIWGASDRAQALNAMYKGDHAGYGETSFMLHGRPDLVRMELLAQRGDRGVSKDPDKRPSAYRASAADGQKMVESAVDAIGRILAEWGLLPKPGA
jgi:creatinine amidohydrolase